MDPPIQYGQQHSYQTHRENFASVTLCRLASTTRNFHSGAISLGGILYLCVYMIAMQTLCIL